jgi:hypothetical protein
MGIVELPTYNTKAVEQFAVDKEVRPDLQAQADMGNAGMRLAGTAASAVKPIAEKIKGLIDQNNLNDITQAKLDIEAYRHSLAVQLSATPLTDKSLAWQNMS